LSIQVDPGTGLKIFNTRAAKATDKIAGKGYSIVEDEALKALPEHPRGAVFNAEEQAKYRQFKGSRYGPRTTWPWKASSASTCRTCTPPIRPA
jgi:cyclohexanone monooxygenase